MPPLAFIVAQTGQPAAPPRELSSRQKLGVLTLILTVIILALIVLGLLVVLRNRANAGAGGRGRSRPRVDAWAESAKRLALEENKRRDPDTGDTVDIDPSELSSGDIEPDSHDDQERGDRKNNGENGHGPGGENGNGKPPTPPTKEPHG